MCWSDAWNRGGQGIKAPTQRDDPSIAAKVVERFPKVGILETYLRGQFSGPLRRKDALSFGGDSAHKLYADMGLL